jgi:hypothetical protein
MMTPVRHCSRAESVAHIWVHAALQPNAWIEACCGGRFSDREGGWRRGGSPGRADNFPRFPPFSEKALAMLLAL